MKNYLERKLKNLGLLNEDAQKMSFIDICQKPIEVAYPCLLQDSTVAYCSLKSASDSTYRSYYKAEIKKSAQDDQAKVLRIARELNTLSSGLPCTHTNSIFVRVDDVRSDVWKVLIFGAEGTPYSGGAFIFDVFMDSTFPNKPPLVTLATTGNGTVRFNPNLYANGKVCLSLLGTWKGNTESENWNPDVST
jgi:ubiquitin-protein ligase